jgi:4-amino-4-deoxy-L-arabinose transferase-like glycosyltransferase
MIPKIKKYILTHKTEVVLVSIIILVSAFLRLYRIGDYMTFLGDEGRDVIVARDILHGHFTLLGPRASAGDFFLGPIYYYMIAPFLLLTNYDPVGPAIMVGLFGIATVFLVFYVGKKLFNIRTGLIAASLYAISPLVISYSRSSWNPNPMPFFSLLLLYFLFIAVMKDVRKYFFYSGLLLGIAMQLHYITVFLGVIVFFFVLIGSFFVDKKNTALGLFKNYLTILIGFIVGFSPFLAFEVRHGFPNTKSVFQFIFESNADKAYLPHESFLSHVYDVFFRLFARLVTNFPSPSQVTLNHLSNVQAWEILTIILAVLSIVSLFLIKEKLKILLFGLWLFFGVVLFGFYKKPIYDYYFVFMFPLPFLLVGNFLSKLSLSKRFKKIGLYVSIIIFIALLAVNLWGVPFRFAPNKQKDQMKRIADTVLSKTENKPFNFALITDGNSDFAYRYFFEVENRAPIEIQNETVDPQRKTVTDQLMVICETQDCQPLGNSLWEIAGFGRAEIAGEWSVPFVKIYKLVHYKGH